MGLESVGSDSGKLVAVVFFCSSGLVDGAREAGTLLLPILGDSVSSVHPLLSEKRDIPEFCVFMTTCIDDVDDASAAKLTLGLFRRVM